MSDDEIASDGSEQVALSRDPDQRQLAEVDRDGRTPICPDCGADVAASKSGGKPLPGIVPECFGWECKRCNLTPPSMCHGPEARGFIDTMSGIEVRFRDGSSRYVPVPSRYVGPDEGGESA